MKYLNICLLLNIKKFHSSFATKSKRYWNYSCFSIPIRQYNPLIKLNHVNKSQRYMITDRSIPQMYNVYIYRIASE